MFFAIAMRAGRINSNANPNGSLNSIAGIVIRGTSWGINPIPNVVRSNPGQARRDICYKSLVMVDGGHVERRALPEWGLSDEEYALIMIYSTVNPMRLNWHVQCHVSEHLQLFNELESCVEKLLPPVPNHTGSGEKSGW